MGLVQTKIEISVETSPQLIESLHMAREVALKTDVAEVLPAHLLLAMLEDDESSFLLDAYGVDFKKIRMQLGKVVQDQATPKSFEQHAVFSPAIEQIMQHAREQAQKNALAEVDSNLILAVILSEENSFAGKMLSPYDLDTSGVLQYLELREGKTVHIDPLPSSPSRPETPQPKTPQPETSDKNAPRTAPQAPPEGAGTKAADAATPSPPPPSAHQGRPPANAPSSRPPPVAKLPQTPPPAPSSPGTSAAPSPAQPANPYAASSSQAGADNRPAASRQSAPPAVPGAPEAATTPKARRVLKDAGPSNAPRSPEASRSPGPPPMPQGQPDAQMHSAPTPAPSAPAAPAMPPANAGNRTPAPEQPLEPGLTGLSSKLQALSETATGAGAETGSQARTAARAQTPAKPDPAPSGAAPSRLRSLFGSIGKKNKEQTAQTGTNGTSEEKRGSQQSAWNMAKPLADNQPQTPPETPPASQTPAKTAAPRPGLAPTAANNNQNPDLLKTEFVPQQGPPPASEAPQTFKEAPGTDPASPSPTAPLNTPPPNATHANNPPAASVEQLVAPTNGTRAGGSPTGAPYSEQAAPPAGQHNRPAKRRRTAPSSLGTNESLSATGSVLEKGRLIEAVPRKMKVNKASRAEVRITRDQLDEINREFEDLSASHIHELAVTEAMTVQLRAPGSGFHIENLSPQTQWIDRNQRHINDADFGVWRWNVTPVKSGKSRLQLVISARTVDDEGNIHIADIPDKIIELAITRDYGNTLKKAGFIALLVLASLALGRYGETAYQWASMLVAKYL